jgi:hypothetical protein
MIESTEQSELSNNEVPDSSGDPALDALLARSRP